MTEQNETTIIEQIKKNIYWGPDIYGEKSKSEWIIPFPAYEKKCRCGLFTWEPESYVKISGDQRGGLTGKDYEKWKQRKFLSILKMLRVDSDTQEVKWYFSNRFQEYHLCESRSSSVISPQERPRLAPQF
tara:strand:- start:3 stop:392 length:390 start_codon:yes stop_codon:yes gene_type:complete